MRNQKVYLGKESPYSHKAHRNNRQHCILESSSVIERIKDSTGTRYTFTLMSSDVLQVALTDPRNLISQHGGSIEMDSPSFMTVRGDKLYRSLCQRLGISIRWEG